MPKHGIVIACDIDSLSSMIKLVKETTRIEGVSGYKIGFTLTLRYGLSTVVEIMKQNTNLPVIFDYQKAGNDIPSMGKPFAKICKESGVDSVIIFPFTGPETQKEFTFALIEEGLNVITGSHMTHSKFLASDGGYIERKSTEMIFQWAKVLGCGSFVIPGNRIDYSQNLISVLNKPDAIFYSPGIGTQGGSLKDFIEMTKNYESYAIIGSAIYNSSDPVLKILEFMSEISE